MVGQTLEVNQVISHLITDTRVVMEGVHQAVYQATYLLTNAILRKISGQRRMTPTSYNTMFDIGYPLQIRGQIIILLIKFITAGQLPGSPKLLVTGNRQLPYCGFMVFVGPERPCLWLLLIVSDITAGSGKTVLWYGLLQPYLLSVDS